MTEIKRPIPPPPPDKTCIVCGKTTQHKKREMIEDHYNTMVRLQKDVPVEKWQPECFYNEILHDECEPKRQELLFEQKINREKEEQYQRRIQRIDSWVSSNDHIPLDLYKKTLESFEVHKTNKSAYETCLAWETTDSFGIMFIGPSGSGKSHLMLSILIKILNEYIEDKTERSHLSVGWYSVSALLDKLRGDFDKSESLKNAIKNYKYLFLDDIGVENSTEWSRDQLFQILDHRVNNKLPTFISTNLNLEEIKSRMHERVLSRIKELCVISALSSGDKRNEIMKAHMAVLKERAKLRSSQTITLDNPI